MPTFLLYILKLSCSLSIVWLFYRIFLHNLTFYNLNRWYLLGYALLSFLIPFIDIGPIDHEDPTLQPLIVQYIPVIGGGQVVRALSAPRSAAQATWTWPGVVLVVLALGAGLLLVRFVVRCLSLRRMRQGAELLEYGQIKIYRVRDRISPFSFGNAIYINTSQHSEKEKEEIILHEYVHIRQRHTADILFAEFLTIFNWFNPFAWLMRYSIRQNLEFIADRQVVENGFDKKDYQYHLLKVIGQAQYRLANNFNFSSLKKRIAMMNKMRSARVNLLKFLFILPLLAVLLVAFRDRYAGLLHHQNGAPVVNIAGIVFNVDGRAPIAGVTVRDRTTGVQTISDSRGFYKLPISVPNDSLRIYIDFTKPGYDSVFEGEFFESMKASLGMAMVVPMWTPAYKHTIPYMGVPYMKIFPQDPDYDDAVKAWKDQLKWNDDFFGFRAMQKAHPEVSLFYTTEDHLRNLVFHKDGSVEKYGYPEGPTMADMEKKYGTLPDFMKPPSSDNLPGDIASPGYLARWAGISAQSEKEFHATSGNPLAIVFPGDSRVIAVAADGQARIYDMDNDDPKERPAFEKTYGRLPDCVPAGFHYNYQSPSRPAAGRPSHVDTTAPRHDTIQRVVLIPHAGRDSMDAAKALWLLDGAEKKGWTNDSITSHRNEITNISIFGPKEASNLFGSRGANGVIAIFTKSYTGEHTFSAGVGDLNNFRKGEPLIVVNGVPVESGGLKSVEPDEIESIQVLKDASAKAIYGDKAQFGVILLTTKPKTHAQVQFEGTFKGETFKLEGTIKGETFKLRADSIVIPLGSLHAVDSTAKP
jgi:TonB-dependent SusC/RagA subfamily outer membrane receptor